MNWKETKGGLVSARIKPVYERLAEIAEQKAKLADD
jgi:hypothetical protein